MAKKQSKNSVCAVAERNTKVLLSRVRDFHIGCQDVNLRKQVNYAYENEQLIYAAADELEDQMERAKSILDEHIRYLNEHHVGCLSSCGVLQRVNHDIDTGITKIQIRTAARTSYQHLL